MPIITPSRITTARVLIVQNDENPADHLQAQLTGLGHSVVGVASSRDAVVRLAIERHPELIILDLSDSGELDWLDTFDERTVLGIPVVTLIAAADASLESAKVNGALSIDSLEKPFTERELQAIVQAILHRHQLALFREEHRLLTISLHEQERVSNFEDRTAPLNAAKARLSSVLATNSYEPNPALSPDASRERIQPWLDEEHFPLRAHTGELGKSVAVSANSSSLQGVAHANSDALFRAVFDNAAVGVAVVDSSARFTACNRVFCRLSGHSADALVGRTLSDLIHPEQGSPHPVSDSPFHTGAKSGSSVRVKFTRPDNTEAWAEVYKSPVDPTLEGLGSGVIVAVDVTEQCVVESQLRQTQRLEAIGQLTASITHEFNNLLTVISGFTSLLLEDLLPGQPGHESALEIQTAGERAATLARQLLTFGRRMPSKPELCDLNRLVNGLSQLFAPLLGDNISMTTQLAGAVAVIEVDMGHMEQALINLVLYARDAMPRGGRLTIQTADTHFAESDERPHSLPPGRYAQLTVSDTGEGIPEESLSRLFDPFFTTKGVEKGSRLGLAVVHGIVQQAHGAITVTSSVGVGTTFRILLPVVMESATEFPQFESARDNKERKTVLLVDDETAVRKLGRLALEGAGYQVLEAVSGDEAIRVAKDPTRPIHLLLADVVMPGMGGRELADHLRKHHPQVRVLLMSGYMDEGESRSGIAPRIDQFIQKPFTPTSLTRRVRVLLDTVV